MDPWPIPEREAALKRLHDATVALLEHGFGEGRGAALDAAATAIAEVYGKLPIAISRARRLRDVLRRLLDSEIGPLTVAQGVALADARRELDHDERMFPDVMP